MRFSCFLLCFVPTVWALGVAAWVFFDILSSDTEPGLETGRDGVDDLLASLEQPSVRIISQEFENLSPDEEQEVKGCTHYKCLDIYR